MVFNATFNNISVVSWRSVLLVEETGLPVETTDLPQVTDKHLSHNVVSSAPHNKRDSNMITLAVICTDCTGSYKSNYQTLMTTTAP